MDHAKSGSSLRAGPGVWVALGFLLAGCAAGQNQPALPLAQGTPRPGAVMPPAQGVTPVAVRTFLSEGGVSRETGGVACDLASPYTTARFTSPANVAVPDLGGATPPVTVTCQSGKLRGEATAQPALQVAETGMSGWPAVGVSVGGGTGGTGVGLSLGGFWNGGTGNGSWTRAVYPPLTVTLR